jgi:Mrp family chromosome partitioning ATPase
MARMLQALKNLEARSQRPDAAGGLLAHLTEQPPAAADGSLAANSERLVTAAQVVPEETPPAIRPTRREAPAVLLQTQTVVMEVPEITGGTSPEPVIVSEQVSAPALSFPPASRDSQRRGRKRDTFGAARPPTSLERCVRRTLSDPSRAQPLLQLAHRLARDLEQTGSKSVLWIGVGTSNGTHESLLSAAAILAAEQSGPTLLIDADLARRPLSEALEYGQEPGLAELLRSGELLRATCRPTAFEKVSLLPAGLVRNVDLAAAGSRLDDVLKNLAADYSLLLVDGGRSADPAAAALARLADATYFVVQLGAVEASEAQAALRDFRAAGARVLGCVAT